MAILSRHVREGRCAGAARWLAVGALTFFLFFPAPGRAAEPPAARPPSAEYQVKAAFLFNFAQFVEWPARAFPDRQAPLVIAILGEDPFGAYLDELVRDESVAGRRLQIRRYQHAEEIRDCHILFVSAAESVRLEEILTALKGRSILTVGDAENFSQSGGMVRLVTENGKTRLRINIEAAREAGLVISSKILRPASIFTKGKR